MIFNVSTVFQQAVQMDIPDSSLLPLATTALRESGYAKDKDMMVIINTETGDLIGSFLFNSGIQDSSTGPERLMSEMGGIITTIKDDFAKIVERPSMKYPAEPFMSAMTYLQDHKFEFKEPTMPKLPNIALPSLELILK